MEFCSILNFSTDIVYGHSELDIFMKLSRKSIIRRVEEIKNKMTNFLLMYAPIVFSVLKLCLLSN